MDQCLLKHSPDIDREVELYTEIINKRDFDTSQFKEDATTKSKKGNDVLDKKEYLAAYSDNILKGNGNTQDAILDSNKDGVSDSKSLAEILKDKNYDNYIIDGKLYQTVRNGKGVGEYINLNDLDNLLDKDALDKGVYSEQDLDKIYFYKSLLEKNPEDEKARKNLFSSLYDVTKSGESYMQMEELENTFDINLDDAVYSENKEATTPFIQEQLVKI